VAKKAKGAASTCGPKARGAGAARVHEFECEPGGRVPAGFGLRKGMTARGPSGSETQRREATWAGCWAAPLLTRELGPKAERRQGGPRSMLGQKQRRKKESEGKGIFLPFFKRDQPNEFKH
jgi:hypothetical protein